MLPPRSALTTRKLTPKISRAYRPMFCIEINDHACVKFKLYPVTLSIANRVFSTVYKLKDVMRLVYTCNKLQDA